MSDVFVITHSGVRFDILEPTSAMVRICDIAHSLSNTGRFAGHTELLYSVAQHSVFVMRKVPVHLQMKALLHDAAEAYIGDITGPLKRHLGAELKAIEHRIETAIAVAFGLDSLSDPLIKQADLRALATERRDLIPVHPETWPCLVDVRPYEQAPIIPWLPAMAKHRFLRYFDELQKVHESWLNGEQ